MLRRILCLFGFHTWKYYKRHGWVFKKCRNPECRYSYRGVVIGIDALKAEQIADAGETAATIQKEQAAGSEG